jgi:hypothetical protein
MKKIVAIALVLALICGAAFAQDDTAAKGKGITVSGWGRGVLTPIKATIPEKGDTALSTGLSPDWGNKGAYIGANIVGATDTVGFNFKLHNGSGITIGTASVWGKPFDFLKLEFGKFEDYSLWGKVGGGDVWADELVGMAGEAAIFSQFGVGAGDSGALLSLTPIDGLFIGVLVKTDNADKLEDTYEGIQIGGGYVIPNIGHFRVQYIGAKDGFKQAVDKQPYIFDTETGEKKLDPAYKFTPSTTITAKRVEAAFAFTGLEGLTVDAGIKYNFPVELTGGITAQKAFQVAVGANYTSGDLGIKGRVDATVGESYKVGAAETTTGLGLTFNLIPSYNLGFATLGGDIGVKLNPAKEVKTGAVTVTTDPAEALEFGIGLWIQKGLGSGHLKTGFALKPGKTTTFSIPVLLEYYF